MAQHDEHQQDQQNCAKAATGCVAPLSTVRIRRGTGDHEQQDDDQQEQHGGDLSELGPILERRLLNLLYRISVDRGLDGDIARRGVSRCNGLVFEMRDRGTRAAGFVRAW